MDWWHAKPKKRIVRRRRRPSSITPHYQQHKAAARQLVEERLRVYNQHYQLSWNRVAIRNQRRCWGSCSSLRNLNFSYRLLFLPLPVADYVIVHELCHLQELHHGPAFWELVAETLPNYKDLIKELRSIEKEASATATMVLS